MYLDTSNIWLARWLVERPRPKCRNCMMLAVLGMLAEK